MATNKPAIRLTATDETSRAFRSVQSGLAGLQREAKAVQNTFSGLRSTFATLGGLVVGIGAVSGLKTTLQELADLNDGATQAGTSVESLSSLLNTLAPTGIGLQEIVDLAGKITKAMSQAEVETSKQAKAFAALGVATKDAYGNFRGADLVLADVAAALTKYGNDANKVAIAQALLEKSGARYLPILGDLASRSREAANITSDQALAADDLLDSINELTRSFTMLRQELVGGVAPALSDFFKRYLALAKLGSNPGELISGLFGDSPADRVSGLQRRIDELKRIREEMAKAGEPSIFQRALNPSLRTKDSVDQELIDLAGQLERAKQIKEQFDKLFAAPPAAVPLPAPPLPTAPPKPTRATAAAVKIPQSELTDDQDAIVSAYKAVQKAMQDTVGVAQTFDLSIKMLDESFFSGAISVEQYDAAMAKLAGTSEKVGNDGAAALRQFAAGWLDQIDPMREFIRNIEQVEAAVNQGFLSPEQAKEIKKRLAQVGQTFTEAGQFAIEAARNIQDTLGQGLYDILDGNFQDIGKSFGNMIKRMVAEAMAADLGRFLLGDFGKTGSVGGILGGIFGLFGGARAGGGPVWPGSAFLVGEKGPELFVPSGSGYIVPNGAGGGIVVNQSISVGRDVSAADVYRVGQQTKFDTIAAIREATARGDTALLGA